MTRPRVIALLIWSLALVGPAAVASGSADDAVQGATGSVRSLVPTASSPDAVAAVEHSSALHAHLPAWTWLVIFAVAAGMVAAARVRRRTAVLLLLLLTLAAFDTAVHSVHHGAGSDDAKRCAVASAWAQVSGLTVEPAQVEGAALAWAPVVTVPTPPHLPVRPLRTYEGRAPPSAPPPRSS